MNCVMSKYNYLFTSSHFVTGACFSGVKLEKFHCSIEIVINVPVLYIYRSDLTCYVCDRVCRNQKLYDQHVKKCLAEATQIQKQIDTRGLEMVQDEEDVTPSKRIQICKYKGHVH
jgi:uncharacterized C2H2 Zn-finger protein